MITIWKKFRTLLSGMEHNRNVPRHPAHLLYALLNFLSILAALVMHGDVRFTLSVIALLLPVSFVVFVPYRYCNILSRMLLNTLIFGAGCFWIMFRLKHNIPLDKMMIEVLALWSLTFLTTGNSRGYFYLLFIDIIMLLYAALLPRLLSLYLSIGAFITILIILFRNRTGFLSGDMLLRTPGKSFIRTWHFHFLWLLIAGVIFHFIFGLIPLRDNAFEGFVPVSFDTRRESFASPELRQWLNSGKNIKNGPDGKETSENAEGENLLLSKDGSGKTLQLQNPPANIQVIPGNGGTAMGKDLVFRVKSPLKLYHLARLYDHYNGTEWRVSRRMARNNSKAEFPDANQLVKLSYSQEKLFSAHLAIPWQMVSFSPDETSYETFSYSVTLWGVTVKKLSKPLPLKFSASIGLPVIKMDENNNPRILPWPETLHRSAYLQLPANRISSRIRQLARTVTANCTTPYAKALALRDFLRSNYTYKLHASPTPRHRESVDYFLFYLGEGHCEYFASALAVLARCAGLPARVATGFSPGNYNTLTSLFEVFEYHAHAWTQIYIPEFGWLTFDATPPSAIVSETSPPGFGKMRDPFGDQWRIRPPELTEDTIDYMQKIRMKAERKKQQSDDKVSQTLNDIAAAGDKLREELKKEHLPKDPQRLKNLKPVKKPLLDSAAIRAKAAALFKALQVKLVEFAIYIVSSWTRVLTAFGTLLLGTALMLWLFKFLKMVSLRLRLRWLIRKAADHSVPRRAVRSSCMAALLMLELENMGRRNNQELMGYAAALRRDLAPEAAGLFALFYRSAYRSGEITPEEADTAYKHLLAICNGIKGTPGY